MTWMELLNILREQPMKTLKREILIHSPEEDGDPHWEVKEIAGPLDCYYEDRSELSELIDSFPLQIQLRRAER